MSSLCLGLLMVSVTLVRAAGQSAVPHFPGVEGKNLSGRAFNLPRDFDGELNVVLVAFQRKQQAAVDTWTPFLRQLSGRHAALRVYELPTLSRTLKLIRGWIDGGMRSGIPDSAVRATTITLYINKSPFKQALGITSEDEIQVLLVDRAGVIHWRGAGPFSAAQSEALERAMQTLGR